MARALQPTLDVRALRHSRGFTLIEMMVVVVIVGVLAMLAIVGYRKLIVSAHLSEAMNMVQNIRVAQEGYHSETQQYANISSSIVSGPFYPANAAPAGCTGGPCRSAVTAWGATCVGCLVDWSVLPLHVDGPVMFGYATTAGPANTTPKDASVMINGHSVAFPAPSPTDWFLVSATCDLDNSGSAPGGTSNTNVYGTSWSNQVFVSGDGN
jgi:type IV pilus assembly protein PilA